MVQMMMEQMMIKDDDGTHDVGMDDGGTDLDGTKMMLADEENKRLERKQGKRYSQGSNIPAE